MTRTKHGSPHALVFLCALRAALFAEHVFGFLCAYLCDLCVSAVNSIPVSFRFRQGRTGLLACAALLTPAAFAQAPNLAPVVSKSRSRTADLPGEFQPFLTVSLHARVAGYVDRVLVDRGSVVKQGDLLVELSAPERFAQIAEAESKVQAMEADRLQAEAHLAAAQATYDRMKKAAETPGAVA